MTDQGWISNFIAATRPQAMAALLRNCGDLDRAEEAFQEACLTALKTWPGNGPPRDAAAWLIMVGRNAGIDSVRKQSRLQPLPPEEMISDLSDVGSAEVQRLDDADYRDDILRLLFVCCHPDLPATQRIALALRIVSGLTVAQIARAFLVTEPAMEQRITHAKGRVASKRIPFEAPGALERSERLAAVAATVAVSRTRGPAEALAMTPIVDAALRPGSSWSYSGSLPISTSMSSLSRPISSMHWPSHFTKSLVPKKSHTTSTFQSLRPPPEMRANLETRYRGRE